MMQMTSCHSKFCLCYTGW